MIAPETNIDDIPFCVIDTETTGGLTAWNRVIDVAVFRLQGGVVTKKMATLVNPARPIPVEIGILTGISDDMVKRAPLFSDIADQLKEALEEGVFTAHNAMFDFGFLREEFARLGVSFDRPRCCTLKIARALYPHLPSKSLGFLCDSMLIDIADRHRAHGDAEGTAYVLKEMLRVLKKDHGLKDWADLSLFLEAGPLHLPPSLSPRDLATLPAAPGRYEMRGANGAVLAKGEVKNVRRRVLTYFKKDNQSKKSTHLRQSLQTLVVTEHAG